MSIPSVDVVRRAHDALNAGDIDALLSLCSPRFRLDMSDRVFNPAVYEGHDGIRDFYAEVMDVWESFTWQPLELRDLDPLVLVHLRSHGRARGSGLELDREAAMLWRVEDGVAASVTFFREPQEAERAAADR